MPIFTLPKEVVSVLARFACAGKEAYCVGGCVRDLLLGKMPHDWDITTACTPNETLALFKDAKTIPTGIAHGTVTVILNGSALPLEITTFRIDGGYADHRRPQSVQFTASIAEDCARRDFTVNAMAYHPTQGLVDLYHGQEDLVARRIRCVGEPERRFSEDALRILRALRFSSVLDFDIEAETQKAAHALAHTLSHVSKERLCAEFLKLIGGARAADILCAYSDVLSYVLPPLSALSDAALRAPLKDAFACLDDAETRLAACLYLCQVNAESAEKHLHALTVSNATKDTVCALLRSVHLLLPPDRIAMRKRLAKTPYALLVKQLCFTSVIYGCSPAHALSLLHDVQKNGDIVSVSALAVNGHDLSACGYRGAEIGDALQTLLDAVMEERVENEKEALLEFLHFLSDKI